MFSIAFSPVASVECFLFEEKRDGDSKIEKLTLIVS
jgi:hypothetical protein